ncbi:MAG: PG0541 family transporter-associated protein [Spirochaetota bacterium]
MKRIEIFANVSVRDALFGAFTRRGVARRFTLIPVVHGSGSSGPRFGDEVWPEENFMLIVYCGEQEAEGIRGAVAEVKAAFENEGVALFETGG